MEYAMIGCQCRVCTSVDPRDKRLRASIQVRTPEMVIQVDTPPDFRTQCLREGIKQIDAVIYTHSHTDHILGFDDLRRFCEMEDKAMPIYASERTMNDLQRVFQYAFGSEFAYRNYIRPVPIVFDGPFRLGETDIDPGESAAWQHGDLRIGFFPGRKKAAGLLHGLRRGARGGGGGRPAAWIRWCSMRCATPRIGPAYVAGPWPRRPPERIGARQAYFTHMCHDIGHEETERELPKHIRLAYDGLRY